MSSSLACRKKEIKKKKKTPNDSACVPFGYTCAELYIIEEADKPLAERLHLAQSFKSVFGRAAPDEDVAHKVVQHMCPPNLKLFERWTKTTGLCARAYLYNPGLVMFLPESGICYAARYYGEPVTYDERTNVVWGKVNNKWMNLERATRRLDFQYARYRDKFLRTIVSRGNREEKWCYLPQVGLVRWNQCGWSVLRPCATLPPANTRVAQRNAKLVTAEAAKQEAEDSGESDGVLSTSVIELITTESTVKGPSAIATRRPWVRHPWLRVIAPDGTFYSFGFTKTKHAIVPETGEPAISDNSKPGTMSGTFASPDPNETLAASRRRVTGMRVSTEQRECVLRAVQKFQNTGVGFRYITHNCTSFVQMVLSTLFANTPSVTVPDFRMSFAGLVDFMQPQWLHDLKQELCIATRMLRGAVSDMPITSFLTQCATLVRAGGAAITGHAMNTILANGDEHPLEDLPFCASSNILLPDSPPPSPPTPVGISEVCVKPTTACPIVFIPMRAAQWQMHQPGTRTYDGTVTFWSQYE